MGMAHTTIGGYGIELRNDADSEGIETLATALGLNYADLGRDETAVEKELCKEHPHLRLDMVGDTYSGEVFYLVLADGTYLDSSWYDGGHPRQDDPTEEEQTELAALAARLPDHVDTTREWYSEVLVI